MPKEDLVTLAAAMKATDALFALECAISKDDNDPLRKRVYKLRIELGSINAEIRRR